MDEILLLLVEKKANRNPTAISTTEIGKLLGMSQQNVSRRLICLEKDGKIIRKNGKVLVTKKGEEEITEIYSKLKNIFERKAEYLEFSGKIVDGLGEGKYYVQQYAKKIKEKIGYAPYPGTLNIKLDEESLVKRQLLREIEPITIDEFEESGRKYGGLFLYKCKVNGYSSAIVIPLRTHHGSEILELIADKRLKEKLGKGKIVVRLEG